MFRTGSPVQCRFNCRRSCRCERRLCRHPCFLFGGCMSLRCSVLRNQPMIADREARCDRGMASIAVVRSVVGRDDLQVRYLHFLPRALFPSCPIPLHACRLDWQQQPQHVRVLVRVCSTTWAQKPCVVLLAAAGGNLVDWGHFIAISSRGKWCEVDLQRSFAQSRWSRDAQMRTLCVRPGACPHSAQVACSASGSIVTNSRLCSAR